MLLYPFHLPRCIKLLLIEICLTTRGSVVTSLSWRQLVSINYIRLLLFIYTFTLTPCWQRLLPATQFYLIYGLSVGQNV